MGNPITRIDSNAGRSCDSGVGWCWKSRRTGRPKRRVACVIRSDLADYEIERADGQTRYGAFQHLPSLISEIMWWFSSRVAPSSGAGARNLRLATYAVGLDHEVSRAVSESFLSGDGTSARLGASRRPGQRLSARFVRARRMSTAGLGTDRSTIGSG